MKKNHIIIFLLLVFTFVFVGCSKNNESESIKETQEETNQESVDTAEVKGEQKAVVEGFDWGPGVTKTIVKLNKEVEKTDINKEDFNVVEKKESFDWEKFEKDGEAPKHIVVESERTINDVYLSNENGEEVDDAKSMYLTIEFDVSPTEGNPFIYSMNTGSNNWCDPYELIIKSSNNKLKDLEINSKIDFKDDKNFIAKDIENFEYSNFQSSEDIDMAYAYYKPSNEEKNKPLVIWLHGGGEGGKDPRTILLANKASVFSTEEFQKRFANGAHILMPQAETFWMDTGDETKSLEGVGEKSSMYKSSLKELIDKYVSENPDIDPNKIIIGGCSNGGFMTYDMITSYKDYFAAAFPICPAYDPKFMTDEKIENMKNTAIWMIYSLNDDTIDPEKNEIPLSRLLEEKDMKEFKETTYDNVIDLSGKYKDEKGKPFEYNGHWSWIYAFNNDVKDEEGNNLFDWLGEKVK